MEDIEALSSASEAGEVEVVSAPPPPAIVPLPSRPDFVDALSGVTCCWAVWSVFERPWRAARGGVAMGDLLVRRLEARGAFFSWVLIVTEALGAFLVSR